MHGFSLELIDIGRFVSMNSLPMNKPTRRMKVNIGTCFGPDGRQLILKTRKSYRNEGGIECLKGIWHMFKLC